MIEFYQLNEISSVALGKKNVIITKQSDGSKSKVQNRYLVMTVREVYEQFKLAYPNEKIGSTSFSLLRPKHVLSMSDIPQNVCLCKYHTNVDLLLSSLNRILSSPKTTAMFRKALVRNSNDEKCILSQLNWADLLIFQKFSDFEHFSDGFLLSDFPDFHFLFQTC